MSWHNFKPGKSVARDEVVAKLEKYICSGELDDPKQKIAYLQQIRNSSYVRIVYSPRSEKGWGNSPVNPRNWRTPDGGPICEITSIPKSREK